MKSCSSRSGLLKQVLEILILLILENSVAVSFISTVIHEEGSMNKILV